jgi:phosphoribosylaminoimidazole-succinocarboxamide synthase
LEPAFIHAATQYPLWVVCAWGPLQLFSGLTNIQAAVSRMRALATGPRALFIPGQPRWGDSMTSRRKKVYEGKAKILYEGPEPGTLIQYFKDDATAFNAQKKAVLEGKGVLNNRISEFVMQRLTAIGIPNHFIKRLNHREQLIKEVEIVPLEVICRNIAAGSLATRLGLEEGSPLPRSIIEFCYKDDKLGDPLVAEEHITAFNWASTQEIDDIMAMTLRINDFLCGMFAGVGITLVDFKIEFGRVWENDYSRIILADEISPDSCRLWDTATKQKLDKDRFRRDLGDVIESYTEVARRLGILKEMPTVIQGGLH